MLGKLRAADKVVGTRRLVSEINAGRIAVAYVASDADLFVTRKVTDLCSEKNIPVVDAFDMKALGEACGVQVPTASAGIKK